MRMFLNELFHLTNFSFIAVCLLLHIETHSLDIDILTELNLKEEIP